jgi:phage baseplate assembly protein W
MAKPFGILLPVERGNNGYFNQGMDALTQIKSNLINLILTKRGERIMQPLFGCTIHNLVFEQITDNTIASARASVEEAVQLWMPFILIKDVSISKNEDEHKVYATISYNLRSNVKITDTITLVL